MKHHEIDNWDRACEIDASDETRLAAGWVQRATKMDGNGAPMLTGDVWEPAPGVAGKWRLHASGVWVRWVVVPS